MKKNLLNILITILLSTNILAQSSMGISHQAVIRDVEGKPVTNNIIGIQVSILQGEIDGTAVYIETHSPESNANGLVTYVIGKGAVLEGEFAEIDWAQGLYFLKTEVDPGGGNHYSITGITQFHSVPYAMHAKTTDQPGPQGEQGIKGDPGPKGDKGEQGDKGDPGDDKVTDDDIKNWNDAYGWGDHSEVGYLEDESQTIADVLSKGNDGSAQQIKNLANPTDPQDATTKEYVDALLAKIEALELNEVLRYGFIDNRDGSHYNAVKIGDQVWMAENLNYASDNSWCFDNNTTFCNHYGRLYTWDAVMNGASSSSANPSGVRGVCPTGWHVPSEDEWTDLVNYVVSQGHPDEWDNPNGTGNALKSCRQVGSPMGGCNTSVHPRWESDATHYGTDVFGFSALPGGYRNITGSFSFVGFYGLWWSATEDSSARAWHRRMHYSSGDVSRHYDSKEYGFSLRCVRD